MRPLPRQPMRLIEDAVIEEPPEQQVEPTSLSPRRRWLLISANVAGWFVVSIFMTIYNKWLFSIFGLKFPLLVTSVHIAIKVPLAAAAMRLLQVPRLHFEPRVLWWQVMPTGFATALDIGLSNLSFLFITVTYYTIVKSSVPLWILVFSICLGLQRPSIWLGGVVVAIVTGVTLASIGPADAAAPLVDDNVTLTVEPTGTAAGAAAGAADLVVRRLMQLATAGEEVAAEPEAGEEGAGSDGAAESAGTTLLGLVLVLIASLLGGFRWACTQMLLMSRDPAASRCPTSDASDASGTGGVEGGVGGEGGEGERIMGADPRGSGGTEASPARARRANTPSAPREKLGEEGPGHGGQGLHPLAMVLATSPFGFALLLPIALLLELGPLLQYRAEHPESSTARFFALASAGYARPAARPTDTPDWRVLCRSRVRAPVPRQRHRGLPDAALRASGGAARLGPHPLDSGRLQGGAHHQRLRRPPRRPADAL